MDFFRSSTPEGFFCPLDNTSLTDKSKEGDSSISRGYRDCPVCGFSAHMSQLLDQAIAEKLATDYFQALEKAVAAGQAASRKLHAITAARDKNTNNR
jgi:hypothetical protein